MKKGLLFFGVFAILAIGCGIVAHFSQADSSKPGLTRSNLKKLKVGMHFDAARAILGPVDSFSVVPDWARAEFGAVLIFTWKNPDGYEVKVYFDGDARFVRWEKWSDGDSWFKTLRKHLGL